MSIMPSTNLEQALPELLQQRTAAEEAVQAAQREVLAAQARLVEVNRAIAALLKKAGILVSDSAPPAAAPAGSSRAGRFHLVWKTASGQPSAQGTPDASAPVVIGGRPVTFGNRQGRLAPTEVYRNAIGDEIDKLALVDSANGQVVTTSIIWGAPRGKQD
ncbi:MAG: hypothetical protein IT204_05300 [Fimbriimonadaceae bacterium]|nr:hypothetical protein [Fimbriimonadaceae bacterium]